MAKQLKVVSISLILAIASILRLQLVSGVPLRGAVKGRGEAASGDLRTPHPSQLSGFTEFLQEKHIEKRNTCDKHAKRKDLSCPLLK
ncbi:hypothetical protein M413DRAFT_314900 [Hebeloma cylindrosporum]|uniref:Uncharacterized protein n=1 Tax=Hebeloma cylindrosporum TaxID=76867 RepID=A0A0C2YZN6_HEBCY|nr:hypothetical protein M413DRAFT_314900 [Hebeloma cylindrosporum h7]